MKHVVYIRTSTEDQNPENQLKDIQSIIPAATNYTVLRDQQSAFKDSVERDQWNELNRKIKNNDVSDLYVWDWDRMYRNRIKLKQFFELCKIYNVKVHSFRQQWYESLNNIQPPFNEIMIDLMLNLLGWLAEDESKKKSERIKAAVRSRDGITISYNGKRWGRKPLPKQTIDRILKLHNEGKSIRQISSEVKTTEKSGHMRNISKSVVHKVVQHNLEASF